MNNKILRDSYNKSASNYDKQLAEIQMDKYNTMLMDFSWRPFNRILDLGCGTALLYDFLAGILNTQPPQGPSFDYHGIDFSPAMIQIARTRKAEQLSLGNFTELPYPDLFFDQVFSFTAIGLSDDPIARILAQCRRVIKPKGTLVITVLKKIDPLYIENELEKSGFCLKKSQVSCGQDFGFHAVKL